MTPKLHRSVAALAASAVLAAGCSGSDNADPADTTAQTSTETVATNPTTTDPPSTDPPATDPLATDPPATVPPATDPPATEPPGTEPTTPEREVEQAIEFFEEQWKECLRTLPNCDEVAVADRRLGDVNVETAITASLFNQSEYRALRIEELEYRVDGVTVTDGGTTALATVCVTDPVEIAQADGTAVDGAYLTSFQEFELELRDGAWAWTTRTIGDIFEGEENSECV